MLPWANLACRFVLRFLDFRLPEDDSKFLNFCPFPKATFISNSKLHLMFWKIASSLNWHQKAYRLQTTWLIECSSLNLDFNFLFQTLYQILDFYKRHQQESRFDLDYYQQTKWFLYAAVPIFLVFIIFLFHFPTALNLCHQFSKLILMVDYGLDHLQSHRSSHLLHL